MPARDPDPAVESQLLRLCRASRESCVPVQLIGLSQKLLGIPSQIINIYSLRGDCCEVEFLC